ncbi:MAG: putative zinc-binding protein [Limisphaerales bacterium]
MSEDIHSPGLANGRKTIIYACSGCSDAGELADQVARTASKRGLAEMSCLAGIGGRVKHLLKTAERAENIVVVDGCPINCAAKTLRLAGFDQFQHLQLHKLGFRKGSCPVDTAKIDRGVEAVSQLLARQDPAEELQIV